MRDVLDIGRLAELIHQELAERGHHNRFLCKLGVFGDDKDSVSGATLNSQSPEDVTHPPDRPGGSEDLLSGFTTNGQAAQLAQDVPSWPATPTAVGTDTNPSMAATPATLEIGLFQPAVTRTHSDDAPACCTASHAPSVLDAAVAAYKQEKRRLWKVS